VDDLAASPRSHDTIRLTWTHDNDGLDKFTLRYQQNTPAATDPPIVANEDDFKTDKTITRMDIKKNASSNEYSYTLDGLKPDMDYVFAIRGLGADATPDADNEDFAYARTDTADAPDDLMGLELMAGDGLIVAMWDEATDNGSPVTGYEVQHREMGKDWPTTGARSGSTMDTSTMWTVSNLKNGTEYDVRVRAYSHGAADDAGWSDVESAIPSEDAAMTPTPALPIFGAFALGAGLLAAGRRRMKQQRLLR
jgi:hypothetical protein